MPRRIAVLGCAVVIVASACSGSDAESNAAETEEPTVSSSASGEDFCDAISEIQAAEFELEETFGADARQLFDDVQQAAPAEVSGDVAVVIETLDAIAELGLSTTEDDPDAVDAALEILLDPDFTEASENLADYTSDACGIDLGGSEDVGTDLDGIEDLDDT